MSARKLARHLGWMLGVLARDPSQIIYVARWWSSMRQRQLLESRIPWLPFRAIDRLAKQLTPASRVFEYGGGGSTLWFADHAGEVTTVEHDDDWYPMLVEATSGLDGVTVFHRSAIENFDAYVQSIQSYPDNHFDVVVVDGRERVRCFADSLPKVKPGGLIILDDTDRARYAPAFDLASGWQSRTYRGLSPAKADIGVTTFWRRPADNGALQA